jgi:hypothetical protein
MPATISRIQDMTPHIRVVPSEVPEMGEVVLLEGSSKRLPENDPASILTGHP